MSLEIPRSTIVALTHVNPAPARDHVKLSDWLQRFGAREVEIPPNGHCLYGVFFAAAAIYNERIHWTVTHLARDIYACGTKFDAHQRDLLWTLYPSTAADLPVEEVLTRLIQHFDESSDVEVTPVGDIYWGRAIEVAAAAMYMREPIDAIDIIPNGAAQAQLCGYPPATTQDMEAEEVENSRLKKEQQTMQLFD
ncbi:hypothetical protein FI667_g13497, partial [Globisporangium splendens]